MEDRETILRLLRAVTRRMRLDRLLQEVGFAACVILFVLAAFELVRPRFSGALGEQGLLILIATLGIFCAYVLYKALERVPMSRAASLADSRLPLYDELKSAYWFSSQEKSSEFVRAHIANAANTAKRLTGAAVIPLRLPRSMLLAGLLGVILVGAMWSQSDLVRAGTGQGSSRSQTDDQAESARALLAATASDAEEIRQLDRALSIFERDDVSRQELQNAMVEARSAIDQTNMRAAVAREGLAKLARAMRGQPQLEGIAEALEEGRTSDAIAMLQQLREELQQLPPGEDQSDSFEVAKSDLSDVDLQQALGQAARDISGMTGPMDEDTVNRLLENIENADDSMKMQARVTEAENRMATEGGMIAPNSSDSELAPGSTEDGGARPTSTPPPDTANTDLRGGAMFRGGVLVHTDEDRGDDGSTTGSPDGHASALALEGKATKRLDAKLELERVRVRSADDGNTDADESAWFYSASQQQASETAFADARARKDYERADVVNQGRIPIQQRQAVREYFINVHEGENQ